MDSIYTNLLLIALLPVLVLAGTLTRSPAATRVRAGLGLLVAATLTAVGVAVYTVAAGQWVDLALTGLAFLGLAIEWDLTLARLGRRRPRPTAWLFAFGWGASTNRRRPSR